MKVIFLLSVLATTGFQVSTANASSRTEGVLSTELGIDGLKARLKDGFHFNEKAPNVFVVDGISKKPLKLAGREADFAPPEGEWSVARVSLYICDDAVTFCEPRAIEWKNDAGVKTAGGDAKSGVSVPKGSMRLTDPVKGRINRYGFIEDDLAKAQDLAKKQNKRILADFSARWCPGCVRFETETFPTKNFKKRTEGLVKVKIDVDRFESVALSEKFKIKGIPALVVMTSDLEEIDRLVDFQPDSVLNTFFLSIQDDPTPIQKLIATDTNDSAINLRIGRRLLANGRTTEAVRFLSKVKPTPNELWTAKIAASAAGSTMDAKAHEQVLRDALKAEAGSIRSLSWRKELLGLLVDKSEIEKIRDEAAALADALLKNPDQLKSAAAFESVGEFTGYEKLLVAMTKAEILEESLTKTAAFTNAGSVSSDASLSIWKQAAAVGAEMKIPVTAVGPSLRYLIILNQAQQFAEADKLSAALLKKDPANPEIERRRLKALLGLKKFDDAIRLAEKTIKKSYDRNEFWVAESLAKAYIGAGRKDDARKILDQYLGRDDSQWPGIKSTRDSMEKLKSSLSS